MNSKTSFVISKSIIIITIKRDNMIWKENWWIFFEYISCESTRNNTQIRYRELSIENDMYPSLCDLLDDLELLSDVE